MKASTDLLVFDTDDVAPNDRFEFWNDFIRRRLLNVKMDSRLSQTYNGRIEVHGLGDTAIVFAYGDSCSAYRGLHEANALNAVTPRWLLVRTNVPVRIRHAGHDERLRPGDLILVDSKAPYQRDDAPVDYTIFMIPSALARDWGSMFEACAGHRFSHEQGWARLLSSLLAGIGPDLMEVVRQTPASRVAFTSCLLSSLVKMLSQDSLDDEHAASCDTRSDRARRHLYDLMLLWIREQHEDPATSVQSLAKSFRVSTRYVYKLFATYSDGRGFLRYLQDVRLGHVIERFQDERDAHTTISEIAWSCGFSDIGSFARLFKGRYGVSPSIYRKELLGMANAPVCKQLEQQASDRPAVHRVRLDK